MTDSEFFGASRFKPFKDAIFNFYNLEYSWDKIKVANCDDESELCLWLKMLGKPYNVSVSLKEWNSLVDYMQNFYNSLQGGYIGDPEVSPLEIPSHPDSCWQKYKRKLQDNRFTDNSIYEIERSSAKIVSQLRQKTDRNDPVRGMVVGNVQSGKTASMAGVISIAADYGYNLFIVLSGTIDNLRVQTQTRLASDLNSDDGNLTFEVIEKPSIKSLSPHRLQDLFLEQTSRKRYLCVSLKNPTRLRDLINWLNSDQELKKKLKILVIDDEADQASINTLDVTSDEKTTIHKHIHSIVFGLNSREQKTRNGYSGINYIGYSATPYANFLNVATDDSLYPKNFISVLNPSSEYFGPKQIFGIEDVNCGLPIINTITEWEVEQVKNISHITPALKEAVLWFICTVAVNRYRRIFKPVSMLIHTSQKVSKHLEMKNVIEQYLTVLKNDKDAITEIKKVWDKQTSRLTIDTFNYEMSDYSFSIEDYPDFTDIKCEIERIVRGGITYIEMDSCNGSLTYSRNIHICVDNCSSNQLGEYMMRLVYPSKTDKASLALTPAFIVIGGNTLSRGLTLEGLTVSYFLRTTQTADTLMQMGRWFGYRRGYELLPRIWITNRTKEKFEMLTKLDDDLRIEIHNMMALHLSPAEYAPRIDTFPEIKALKLSSANKTQSSIEVEISYANKTGQTTKMYADDDIIESNLKKTIEFINSLGPVDKERIANMKNPYTINNIDNSFLWFEQDYKKVLRYLSELIYPVQKANIGDLDDITKWFDEEYNNGSINNFNIVLSSVSQNNSSILKFDNFDLRLPTRNRTSNLDKSHIYLKEISSPADRLIDIDASKLSPTQIDELKTTTLYKEKRTKFGMNNTPLLVVYIIDKDSGIINPPKNTTTREKLITSNHLVGYFLYIPYGDLSKHSNTNKVCVKLQFVDRGDIDEN